MCVFVSVGRGSAIGYSYDDNGDSSSRGGATLWRLPERKKKRKASVERVIMVGKKFKLIVKFFN